MCVSNNSAGRVRAVLDLGVFVRLEPVAVGGSRGTRELFGRFTFDKIGGDPICGRARWDRCVVAIRRSSHLGAVIRPPETGETNEAAVDGKVSAVADAGCILHVDEIDTSTLAAELTQSCPRVAPELPTPRNPLHSNALRDLADRP
jgi:hypothetical protein